MNSSERSVNQVSNCGTIQQPNKVHLQLLCYQMLPAFITGKYCDYTFSGMGPETLLQGAWLASYLPEFMISFRVAYFNKRYFALKWAAITHQIRCCSYKLNIFPVGWLCRFNFVYVFDLQLTCFSLFYVIVIICDVSQ